MAYRTMRRAALQSRLDEQQRTQAARIYSAIGLPMPDNDSTKSEPITRSHNGSEIISTFLPTPKGPKLNTVHGPLANKEGLMMDAPVVGFPVVGAGQRARRAAGQAERMQVDEERNKHKQKDDVRVDERPYFYPRRTYRDSAIRKQRKQKQIRAAEESKRLAHLQMDIELK